MTGKILIPHRNIIDFIACLLLSAPILAWNLLDESTWPWDQAWYAEESIRLWNALLQEKVNWLDALLNAFHTKAPLIAWFGQFFVPLSSKFGIHAALLLSIWLLSLSSILLTYRTSFIAFNQSKNIALLSALIMASTPLFVGLSHEYLAETYQVLAVSYVYWLYFASVNLNKEKIIYHLLFSMCMVVGSKSSTILYCFIPAIGIINNLFHNKISVQKISFVDLGLLTLSAIFALLLTLWYVKNLSEIYSFGVSASSGTASIYYGKVDSFFNKFIYWINVFFKAILPKYIIVLLILSCIIVLLSKPLKKIDQSKLKLGAFVSFQALIPIIIFSLSVNEESRYILPTLPSIIILLGLVASLNSIVTKIFLCIFAFQYLFVQSFSYGLHSHNDQFNHWLKSVNFDPKIRNRNLDLSTHLCLDKGPILYIVGVEYIDFNFNTLGFLGVLSNTDCKFTSLGFAANNVKSAIERAKKIGAKSIVTLKKSCQYSETDWLNLISKDLVEALDKSDDFKLSEIYDDCILIYEIQH